jgi:hypothetical protein
MTETNSLSKVGWLADRGARSGRCRNDIYCLLANETPALRINHGERFVCPECFKPLREVSDPVKLPVSWRYSLLMVGGGLAVTALCLLVARPVSLARRTVSVFVVLPSAQSPATMKSIAMPSQTAAIDLAARKLASQQNIAYGRLDSMSPAVTLANSAVRQTNLIASPRSARFSAQNRDFSATPIAGGEPAFPDSAQSQGAAGLVRVTCRIETNGKPVASATRSCPG